MNAREIMPYPMFTLPGSPGFVELSLWGDLHLKLPAEDYQNNPYLLGFIGELSTTNPSHACIDLGDMVDKGNTKAVPILEKILENAGILDRLYLLNNGNHDISRITKKNVYGNSFLRNREMIPGNEYVISGKDAAITIMMVNSFIGYDEETELSQIQGQEERLQAYHKACDELILPQLKDSLAKRSQNPLILLLHYPLFHPYSSKESLGDQRHLSESCIQAIDDTVTDNRGQIIGGFHAHRHGRPDYTIQDLYTYTKNGIPLINASGIARVRIGLPFITHVQITFQNEEKLRS